MTTTAQPGATIHIKQEKRGLLPLRATIIDRSGSYPGWNVRLDCGTRGIVLDKEIASVEAAS